MVRRISRVVVGSALLQAMSAAAQEPLPASFLEAQQNERGQRCELHEQRADGARLLLACGAAGVWEVVEEPTGPRFVRSYEQAGDVVGFFSEPDGRLWVKLRVLEARPFSPTGSYAGVRFPDEGQATTAAPAPAPTASSSPPKPSVKPTPSAVAASGRVSQVLSSEVVVTLGTADDLSRGDRLEFFMPPTGEESDDAPLTHDVVAVGVVTHVAEHTARVRLGVNENVPIGAIAMLSQTAVTASLTAPPRASNFWSFEATFRPFAALGKFGGGALLSGAVGRRWGSPFHLQAIFDPLGLVAVEDSRSVTAANAALIASYDARFFEMGFGVGGQSVNSTNLVLEPGSGLSVVQLIRLGALDGLNLTARTSVVLFHSEFGFGGMVANLQIPVSAGYWLMLGGGGGDVGYGYGEIGLRTLLDGNGGAGSKFLYVSAGGAGMFETKKDCFGCGVSYGGPMAGIGGEWRF